MIDVKINADQLLPVIEATIVETLNTVAILDQRQIAYGETEAAKLIGVPASVLRNARIDGELKASKLGRRIVYERSELIRWIQDSKI